MNLDTENRAAFAALVAAEPQTIPCRDHPDQVREIIRKYQWGWSVGDWFEPNYYLCPVCRLDKQNARLAQQGVPPVLLHCNLDNWLPVDDAQKAVLSMVRDYAERGRGFLILLGPVGTGKSHLAVGVMRWFPSGLFIKQSGLLKMLRDTYNDKSADDPIEEAQKPDILVIDEVGVSPGGKDEWPMIHDILCSRYEQVKGTILTSNLAAGQFKEMLGERLTDRLSECAVGIVTLSGISHRAERRDQYGKITIQPKDHIL